MRARRILIITVLAITLVATISSRTNLLPQISPAHAITCPTGGASNGCLTVSLDVNSRSTKTSSPTCAVPSTDQYGVCDTSVTTSASNATTFRIGAVLNASAANKATSTQLCGPAQPIQCGVWVWQFGILYDPTIVTPQGDPSSFCTARPDCGENTVWYGSQTGTGTINWASYDANHALHTLTITEDPATPHVGEIVVGFAFEAPAATPVEISARNVLANVAFELVGKGTATFTIVDVIFGDEYGFQIPGIIAASSLQNDRSPYPYRQNRLKFVDSNGNGVWDAGEPVIYDNNGDGKFSAGTYYTDTLIAGTAPANNTALAVDPKIRFLDLNGNNVWDTGEPVAYDSNNNNLYDTGEPVIAGPTPVTRCLAGLFPSSTCGAVSDVITNDPPHASFTVTQISPYAFAFSSTSTDSDGTVTGYYWDFGDGTQDLNVSGSTVFPHDYSVTCATSCPDPAATFPGNFQVTLRIIDNQNATGAARDSSGSVIANTQPSHTSLTALANKNPIAAFTYSPLISTPGQPTAFDASTSTDDDTIISYSWNFGDGTPNATGITATHAFTAPNTYTVTLAVKDSFNAVTKITHTIIIDAPPSLSVTSPNNAQAGTTVTVNLSSSTSFPGGSVTSVKVDWGDGKTDTLSGTATTATHTYTNAGNYNVTITATDDKGVTATKTQTINVTAAPTGITIPGGVATIIIIPIAAIIAVALILLRRRKQPSQKGTKAPQPTG